MSENSNLPTGGTGTADDISDEAFDEFFGEDTANSATEPEASDDEDIDASADDEGLDDEAEDEGEDNPDAEAEEGSKEDPTVKLNDGTEIKLSELVQGYQRLDDYTRKTQALAETRKRFEATAAQTVEQVRQREKQVDQAFNDVVQLLAAQIPREPDPSLAATDVAAYVQQRALYDQQMAHINAIMAGQKQAREQASAQEQQYRQQWLQAEARKVAEVFPQATDPQKGKTFWESTLRIGQELGFSLQELEEMDSRAVIGFAKLAQYQARERGVKSNATPQKASIKEVASKLVDKAKSRPQPVVRKGSAPSGGASEKALRQFRQTRSVAAAERAWDAIEL